MDKLTDLISEATVGQIQTNLKIVMKIDKTAHAGDRQSRHDSFISDKDIIATANKALPKLSKMLVFDKLDIGDKIVIFDAATTLNLVCRLEEGRGVINLVIITVMREKHFNASRDAKVVRV